MRFGLIYKRFGLLLNMGFPEVQESSKNLADRGLENGEFKWLFKLLNRFSGTIGGLNFVAKQPSLLTQES
jgi:hypothetical protein